jgi:hypothetical protein
MKKPLHVYILFLVSAVLMVYLLQQSEAKRVSDRTQDVGKDFLTRERMITGGFDSVFANFIWMRTNLRPEKSTKGMSKAEKEEHSNNMAKRDFAGFLKVVKLDPMFKKAYKYGILRVRTELPDKAIGLAERAIHFMKEDRKEFAEMASTISTQVKKDYNEALKFLTICVDGGGPNKDYLGRQYLRTVVRLDGIDPRKQDLITMSKIINIYHELYMKSSTLDGAMSEMPIEGEGAPMMEEPQDPGISYAWVMPELRKNVKTFLTRVGIEKNDVPKKAVFKVKKIFEDLMPSPNACKRCYNELHAGDHFCTFCGLKAQVHGVCKRDGTVLKGNFCHKCGDPSPYRTGKAAAKKPL